MAQTPSKESAVAQFLNPETARATGEKKRIHSEPKSGRTL